MMKQVNRSRVTKHAA